MENGNLTIYDRRDNIVITPSQFIETNGIVITLNSIQVSKLTLIFR